MIGNNKDLPCEIVDIWPEIFNEVTITALPLLYVEKVRINFKDGKTWELGISSKNNKKDLKKFEEGVSEILKTYDEFIEEVDVKINTGKVRKDVEKSIKRMLKKIKL
jgi:hypothetical protein